ncbi:MAG: hypothetical protein WCA45_13165 [Thiobacillaceae bacterium]
MTTAIGETRIAVRVVIIEEIKATMMRVTKVEIVTIMAGIVK